MSKKKLVDAQQAQDRIKSQIERYRFGTAEESDAALIEIINEHSGLIGHIIDKHFPSYKKKYYEDMYSCGKCGLISAIAKYDPEQSKPSTYFSYYIHHEIYEYVNNFLAGISTHHAPIVTKVSKALQDFAEKGIDNPTVDAISRSTGLETSDVIKALNIRTGSQMKDYINDEYLDSLFTDRQEFSDDPSDVVYKMYADQALIDDFTALSELEQKVLLLKFGFITGHRETHADIASMLNVKVEQIRPIVNSGLSKLRHGSELPKYYQDNLESLRKDFRKNDIQCMPTKKELNHTLLQIMSDADEVDADDVLVIMDDVN